MADPLNVPPMNPIGVNVDFGKVSIGAETLSVGIKFARAVMPLADAARVFCNTRLSVKLSNQTDQRELFDNRVEVVGVGDTKGIGVKPDWISFTLGFKRPADSHDLFQSALIDLAQCEGRLTVTDVAAIPEKGDADGDEGDEPEGEFSETAEGQRQLSLVFASGQLVDLVDPTTGKKVVTPSKAEAFEKAGLLTCEDLQKFIDKHPETFLARLQDLVKGCGKVLAQKIFDAYQMAATAHHASAANSDSRWFCAHCGHEKPAETRDGKCQSCNQGAGAIACDDLRINTLGMWEAPDESDDTVEIYAQGDWLVAIDLYRDAEGLWRASGVIVNHEDDKLSFLTAATILEAAYATAGDAAKAAQTRLVAQCDAAIVESEPYPFDGDVRALDVVAEISRNKRAI